MSEVSANPRNTKFERAYFAELRLQNVRAFGPDARLSLRTTLGLIDRWTVIVGENATGKSSLLECLYGMRAVDFFVKDGEQDLVPAFFGLSLNEDVGAKDLIGDQFRLEASFAESFESVEGIDAFYFEVSKTSAKAVGSCYRFYSYPYSAGRRIKTATLESDADLPTVGFLSSEPQDIASPTGALMKADYTEKLGGVSKPPYEKLIELVCELLPNVERVRAYASAGKNEPSIQFRITGQWQDADQSGYGYLSTLAWVLDFAFKLAEAFPDLEDPLQAPAVCLVDEIDLHLHPQWQRTIVKTLLDTFPNVQFIVTAHSPIMVQASAGHNIVLLRRNTETGFVDIVNDLDEIANWRLDQILTSELFGFDSARPAEQTKLMRERIGILQEAKPTEEQKRRVAEIEAELKNLPRGSTAEKVEMNRILDAALDRLNNPANWL